MKSQIAMEFLVIFAALGILSLLILNVIKITDTANIVDKYQLEARNIADTVAIQINTIYLLGNGANGDVKLPVTLSNGNTYNLSLDPENHLVSISWDGERYTAPIVVKNVTLLSVDNDLLIKNSEGKIVIT